jgi:hypothetical protein
MPVAVQPGADLCLDLTVDASGQVTDLAVSANTTSSLKLCGEISGLTEATGSTTGSLGIAGQQLPIAAGANLPASVRDGANLCLNMQLNGLGQIKGTDVSANAGPTLQVCGIVTDIARATATKTGKLAIEGQQFTLASGSSIPASVDDGANLCMSLKLNGFGQVSRGTAQANVTTVAEVCGQVDSFTAASETNDGRLAIGNVDRDIAAGTPMDRSVRAGAFVQLRYQVDAFGRIADASVLRVGDSLAGACGSPAASPAVVLALPASPAPASPAPDAGPAAPAPAPTASPTPGAADPSLRRGTEAAQGARAGAGAGVQPDRDSAVPDTASVERVGRVVTAMASPLLAFVAGGLGAAAWSVRRRRRDPTGNQVGKEAGR